MELNTYYDPSTPCYSWWQFLHPSSNMLISFKRVLIPEHYIDWFENYTILVGILRYTMCPFRLRRPTWVPHRSLLIRLRHFNHPPWNTWNAPYLSLGRYGCNFLLSSFTKYSILKKNMIFYLLLVVIPIYFPAYLYRPWMYSKSLDVMFFFLIWVRHINPIGTTSEKVMCSKFHHSRHTQFSRIWSF